MDKLIHPSEAAEILGMSRTTVYTWFWQGKLLGVKYEGKFGGVRILESSVMEQLYKGLADEEVISSRRGCTNMQALFA